MRAVAATLSAALVLALPALRATAEVKFEVGGAVEAAEDTLDVRVDVTNGGDVAATALDVRGELGGEEDVVVMPDGVPAGATRSVMFRFSRVPSPGVHVLGLRLDYTEAPAKGGTPVTTSQRAYLLLGFGAAVEPAVRVSASEATVGTRGVVPVRLESADGAAHRVRVRVLTPRGLNAEAPVEVDVPATGAATAEVGLLRGSVPRPSRQGVLVVTEVVGGEVARATVTASLVHVEPFSAVLPRARWPLGIVSVLLLLAAAAVEARSRRRRAAETAGPDAEVRPSS